MALNNNDLESLVTFMNALQAAQAELENTNRLIVTKLEIELADEESQDKTEAEINLIAADDMIYLTT